jgi:arylsulfatase A-like enzyme
MSSHAPFSRARFVCFVAMLLFSSQASIAADRPNIVYILADDLGWKDVGFHEGKIPTPNLDKLAAGGAILNTFYAQPFSSQTRAALITGRYPMRYGLQTMSILPASRFGLPTEERTLAQALKESGYKTALLGKWQLGHAKPEFWPTKRGFDYFYGTLTGEVEARLTKTGKNDWRRNDQALKEEGFVTQLLAKDATAQIARFEGTSPFFLLLSFTQPSAPAGAPKELLEKFAGTSDEARRTYMASVAALDQAVGDILAALGKKGVTDKTLVIFHSDNGGAVPTKFPTGDGDVKKSAADNDIFREGKGSLYEGGVRVVALASWPGKIKAGTVVNRLLHVTDMYTTLLTLGGAKLDQPKKPDGLDVWPTIADEKLSPHEEILLNVEDFRGAIRVGEWKLVVRSAMPIKMELFNIANDPEEADNKAEAYPDRVKELLGKLNAYAYEMTESKYLEELAKSKSGETPIFWGHNPPRR